MIKIFRSAKNLPPEWDMAAGQNFALHKDNLVLLEQVNPCNQTYIIFTGRGMCSIMLHYRLKLNIFCYSSLKLHLPVTVIGVPCSVCQPGYSFERSHMEEINKYMESLRGVKIILNADNNLCLPNFTRGYTLPSCVLKIDWSSFYGYLNNLRNHYRYRYKKALSKIRELSVGVLKGDFTEEHYKLYEQVYDKSQYKLEKLPIDYFRKSKGTIVEFCLDKVPLAFVQYTIMDKEMVFLFGGLDYKLNKQYDLYLNMLLCLVREAIENNCTHLNLGQTAEEIKCRLGAFQEEKYLYINHSNPVINSIASMFKNFFSYKMKDIKLTVLKR